MRQRLGFGLTRHLPGRWEGETNMTNAIRALLLAVVLAAPAAMASPTTAQGSRLLLPDGAATGRPAVILLPFTGGSAQRLYDWRYSEVLPAFAREANLIIVIPPDRTATDDYSTAAAWSATLQHYTDSLAADTDEIVRKHGADPRRIVLAGYSMGGDIGWALPLRDTERYAGAVIMGSRTSYRAKGALEKLAARGFRYFMYMGEREFIERERGMDAARAALLKSGVAFQNAEAFEDHIPAPPETFVQGLRYVLGMDALAEAAEPLSLIKPMPPTCPGLTPFRRVPAYRVGFRNAAGETAIAATLGDARAFSGPFAQAWMHDGRAGHVDCGGRFIQNDEPGRLPFSEGLARSKRKGLVGYVNTSGEPVIPFRYEAAGRFCHGVARVGTQCTIHFDDGPYDLARCGSTHFIERSGATVATPQGRYDPEQCEGVRSLPMPEEIVPEESSEGDPQDPLSNEDSSADAAREDEAAEPAPPLSQERPERLKSCDWQLYEDPRVDAFTVSPSGRAKNTGYRDAQGRMAVPPRFTDAEPFGEDGLAAVYVDNEAGYIDCEGKTFSVLDDGGADAFSDGLVRFVERERMGFRNRRGETVIPARYDYAEAFCEGIAEVGQRCAIDRDGREITAVQCASWQHIDLAGKVVVPPKNRRCADEDD